MTAALLDAADPPSSPSVPQARTSGDTSTRTAASRYGPFSGPRHQSRRRPYRQLSKVGQWQARAHAARPGPGQFVRPQLAEVVIPAGYRPVLDRAEAAVLVDELPEATAALREDSRATRVAVWAALVEHLHPETGLIIASHAQLGERASAHRGRRVPRSTVGDHVRALIDAGLLHVAQYGASGQVLGTERNRAPTYVVLAPQLDEPAPAEVDEPLTPEQLAEVARLDAELAAMTAGVVDELRHLPKGSAHTRMEVITHPRKNPHFLSSTALPPATHGTPHKSILGSSLPEPPGPARREHPERYQPRTGPEREIAVAWITAVMGWATERRRFAALADKELRKITGPFFATGWSPAAIVRAFRVRPDGSTWDRPLPTPDQRDSADQPRIRNLWAVLTHRLAAWRDLLGHPLDPPFPSEQPPRGRPRKPPAPPPVPPAPARGAQVEAEYAAARASLAAKVAARQARRHAEQVDRERRWQSLGSSTLPMEADPPPAITTAAYPDPGELAWWRAFLRSRIEKGLTAS